MMYAVATTRGLMTGFYNLQQTACITKCGHDVMKTAQITLKMKNESKAI
jgi:hypothetical protein